MNTRPTPPDPRNTGRNGVITVAWPILATATYIENVEAYMTGLVSDLTRAQEQIADLQERIEEAQQRLKHYEDSPWTSSTMLEQIENKKYATYSDEEFELFFEYSVDCKCNFCAFIRYVIELRKLTAPIAPEKEG